MQRRPVISRDILHFAKDFGAFKHFCLHFVVQQDLKWYSKIKYISSVSLWFVSGYKIGEFITSSHFPVARVSNIATLRLWETYLVIKWTYSSTILGLDTRWRWVVTFTPGLFTLRYPLDEAGWAPESVWTLWTREKLFTAGNRTLAVQSVTRWTQLSRPISEGLSTLKSALNVLILSSTVLSKGLRLIQCSHKIQEGRTYQ
jgi:hypothetical protein